MASGHRLPADDRVRAAWQAGDREPRHLLRPRVRSMGFAKGLHGRLQLAAAGRGQRVHRAARGQPAPRPGPDGRQRAAARRDAIIAAASTPPEVNQGRPRSWPRDRRRRRDAVSGRVRLVTTSETRWPRRSARHYVGGRLDADALNARVDAVYGAEFRDEAQAVLADLPAPVDAPPVAAGRRPPAAPRHGESEAAQPGWRPTPERFLDPMHQPDHAGVGGPGRRHAGTTSQKAAELVSSARAVRGARASCACAASRMSARRSPPLAVAAIARSMIRAICDARAPRPAASRRARPRRAARCGWPAARGRRVGRCVPLEERGRGSPRRRWPGRPR